MMSFCAIPYFENSFFGIIHGVKSFCISGSVNLITEEACGESQNAICLIPKPNEILAASGEQKLMVSSGSNFLILGINFSIRETLASNFAVFPIPPCFPTEIRLKFLIFANFDTS